MTIVSKHLTWFRASRFFRTPRSQLHPQGNGKTASQWRHESRIFSQAPDRNDGNSSPVLNVQVDENLVQPEITASSNGSRENFYLRDKMNRAQIGLAEGSSKSRFSFPAAIAYSMSSRQPATSARSPESSSRFSANDMIPRESQNTKYVAQSPVTPATVAQIPQVTASSIVNTNSPSRNWSSPKQGLYSAMSVQDPAGVSRHAVRGDSENHPALYVPFSSRSFGSGTTERKSVVSLNATPLRETSNATNVSSTALSGFSDQDESSSGNPRGDWMGPNQSQEMDEPVADNSGAVQTDDNTFSETEPSGVAGELWLDTLPLRNWFQVYLSTEIRHASPAVIRTQSVFAGM